MDVYRAIVILAEGFDRIADAALDGRSLRVAEARTMKAGVAQLQEWAREQRLLAESLIPRDGQNVVATDGGLTVEESGAT